MASRSPFDSFCAKPSVDSFLEIGLDALRHKPERETEAVRYPRSVCREGSGEAVSKALYLHFE